MLKTSIINVASWTLFLAAAGSHAVRAGYNSNSASPLGKLLSQVLKGRRGGLLVAAVGTVGALLPALAAWRVGPLTLLSKLLLGQMRIEHEPSVPRKQRGQRPKDYPPPFPNGWFRILGSWELPPKFVKPIHVLGHDLVLYRTESGEVAVLDAFCPHLGAHLGIGGTVNGNCIRCPFHGWEIDQHGTCVFVPECPSPAETAAAGKTNAAFASKVEAWHVAEYFDAIFLWHDSEKREPTWWPNDPNSPPPPAQLVPKAGITPLTTEEVHKHFARDQYYLAGSTHAVVHTHAQEIPENGPDVAHLNVLHQPFVIRWLQLIFNHRWTAKWSSSFTHTEDKERGVPPHLSTIYLTQCAVTRSCDNVVPSSFVPAYINQIGPGIVRLRIILGGRFEVVVHEYVTPFAPTSQHAVHTVHARHGTPRWLAQMALWALDAQFQRDVPIWEQKKFEPRPILSPVDGPIPSYRRWYAQFYGPSSLSFVEAVQKENMLDDW